MTRVPTFLFFLFLFLLPPAAAETGLERRIAVAVRRGNEAEVCSLLEELTPTPGVRMVRFLFRLAVVTPSERVYGCTRKALARLTGRKEIDAVASFLARKKSFDERALAVMVLGDLRDPSALERLVPLLKDRDPRIRVRAAEALGGKRKKESVDALVAVLAEADKVPGEFSAAIRRSLFRLTGMNLRTARDWAKWWRTFRKTWRADSPAAGSGRTAVEVKPPGKFPRFFGVEIYSLRVVFVIDVSGSMDELVKNGNVSKIDLVKEELIRLVREMRPETRFCIIAFSDKIVPHARRLVPATPANKTKAIRFIRNLKAGGFTWTREALEKAFSYREANTIVLLSDGTPCKKGNPRIPTKPILEWVAKVNRFRKVTEPVLISFDLIY